MASPVLPGVMQSPGRQGMCPTCGQPMKPQISPSEGQVTRSPFGEPPPPIGGMPPAPGPVGRAPGVPQPPQRPPVQRIPAPRVPNVPRPGGPYGGIMGGQQRPQPGGFGRTPGGAF